MKAVATAVLVTALTMLAPAGARADEPRPVPDYDGRPAEGPNVGEVLIWIPRVILFPGYLLTEYVIRRPLGVFVTWLEQKHVVQEAYSLFTFGSDGRFGIFPTALFDFGLRPSVGLYAFIDPLFHHDNRFRISAAYGGEDWISVGAKERVILRDEDGGEIILRGGYSRRPDFPFYGIGPDARQLDEVFYRRSLAEVALSLGLRSEHAGFSTEMRFVQVQRDPSDYDDHTIGENGFDAQYFVDAGVGNWPDGSALEHTLDLFLDSRRQGPVYLGSGTGARLDLRGGFGFDPEDSATERWVRYGGEASLFLDITGTRRVLGANVSVGVVEPLGDGPVPASALVALGGLDTMRAFYEGRFLGQIGVTGTLDYRWPIASFLDAELFASVGNVFGAQLEGFSAKKLAGSGGLALRTNTSRDLSFDVLIALGTRQFDEGPLVIDSVRFAFGTNRGF